MRKLIVILFAVPISLLAVTSVTLGADMINPAELKWSITSTEILKSLDFGQYEQVPGGCAVDPLPRGGDVLNNGGEAPIRLKIGSLPDKVVLAPADEGKLLVLTVQAKTKEGNLPCWPSWWACDVGIGSGWIVPCVAVSAYKDADGSLWNVADVLEKKPKLSLLTRHVSDGETVSLTLVFNLKKWQMPKKGNPIKLLVLAQAAQMEAP